jgi:hypothetical protein
VAGTVRLAPRAALGIRGRNWFLGSRAFDLMMKYADNASNDIDLRTSRAWSRPDLPPHRLNPRRARPTAPDDRRAAAGARGSGNRDGASTRSTASTSAKRS